LVWQNIDRMTEWPSEAGVLEIAAGKHDRRQAVSGLALLGFFPLLIKGDGMQDAIRRADITKAAGNGKSGAGDHMIVTPELLAVAWINGH